MSFFKRKTITFLLLNLLLLTNFSYLSENEFDIPTEEEINKETKEEIKKDADKIIQDHFLEKGNSVTKKDIQKIVDDWINFRLKDNTYSTFFSRFFSKEQPTNTSQQKFKMPLGYLRYFIECLNTTLAKHDGGKNYEYEITSLKEKTDNFEIDIDTPIWLTEISYKKKSSSDTEQQHHTSTTPKPNRRLSSSDFTRHSLPSDDTFHPIPGSYYYSKEECGDLDDKCIVEESSYLRQTKEECEDSDDKCIVEDISPEKVANDIYTKSFIEDSFFKAVKDYLSLKRHNINNEKEMEQFKNLILTNIKNHYTFSQKAFQRWSIDKKYEKEVIENISKLFLKYYENFQIIPPIKKESISPKKQSSNSFREENSNPIKYDKSESEERLSKLTDHYNQLFLTFLEKVNKTNLYLGGILIEAKNDSKHSFNFNFVEKIFYSIIFVEKQNNPEDYELNNFKKLTPEQRNSIFSSIADKNESALTKLQEETTAKLFSGWVTHVSGSFYDYLYLKANAQSKHDLEGMLKTLYNHAVERNKKNKESSYDHRLVSPNEIIESFLEKELNENVSFWDFFNILSKKEQDDFISDIAEKQKKLIQYLLENLSKKESAKQEDDLNNSFKDTSNTNS